MMRPIDADKLLEKMQDRLPKEDDILEPVSTCAKIARRLVEKAPTIDAVEVVHGRWEQIGYDEAMNRITCSCCLEYWNIEDNDTETFNYCPNCGAKMDGDENG